MIVKKEASTSIESIPPCPFKGHPLLETSSYRGGTAIVLRSIVYCANRWRFVQTFCMRPLVSFPLNNRAILTELQFC